MHIVCPLTRGGQEQDNDKQDRREVAEEECMIALGTEAVGFCAQCFDANVGRDWATTYLIGLGVGKKDGVFPCWEHGAV